MDGSLSQRTWAWSGFWFGGNTFWGSALRGVGWSGEFWKIFNKFLKKIVKMHYFIIYFKYLANHALIFRMFGRKTQLVGKSQKILKIFDKNSIKSRILFRIFVKFVTKNRPYWNKTIFLQQFFGFGGFPSLPPGYAPARGPVHFPQLQMGSRTCIHDLRPRSD